MRPSRSMAVGVSLRYLPSTAAVKLQRGDRGGADLRRLLAGIEGVAAPAVASGAAAAIPVFRDLDLDIDRLPGDDGDMGELVDVAPFRIDRDIVFAGRDVAIERSARLGDTDDPAVEADIGRRQADIGFVIAIDPDAGVAGRRTGGCGQARLRRLHPAEKGEQQNHRAGAAKPGQGGGNAHRRSPFLQRYTPAGANPSRQRGAESAAFSSHARGSARRRPARGAGDWHGGAKEVKPEAAKPLRELRCVVFSSLSPSPWRAPGAPRPP